jgi:fumarate hydratase subunit beta
MKHIIKTPLTKDALKNLKAGDTVSISGIIYTARDAAHKRMISLINQNERLPFNIENQIIYYVGPCPSKQGQIIGSAGPTTSSRMDAYAPKLIELGLCGMIGKGLRSKEVIDAMVKYGCAYFGATGGAGALLAKAITAQEIIAFPELGPESIRKLIVKDFPVTVIIDCYGNNLYETGRLQYSV